ncbi:YqzL family protein [Paenibacillus sp. CAU 1782]
MRDFSWNYFALTGDVESFMLYKEVNNRHVLAEQDSMDDEEYEAADADF